ncbi:hypothetical protein H0H93_016103 [Arthromyces matolae]|nr:hypothetical protein H0H93_016103 [Arthromyces matolae]
MADDDYDMEDVSSQTPAFSPVPPPQPSELRYSTDREGFIVAVWGEKPAAGDVSSYLARWPPSRTPGTYAAWISVQRGSRPSESQRENIAGLGRDWEILKQRAAVFAALEGPDATAMEVNSAEGQGLQPRQKLEGNPIVTVEALDALALAHSVLSGKWLIYSKPHQIDGLWSRIVTAVIANAPEGVVSTPRAKVSTARPGEPHVICVYVDDYSDAEEVGRVREALRKVGVSPSANLKFHVSICHTIAKEDVENEHYVAPKLVAYSMKGKECTSEKERNKWDMKVMI